MALREEIGRLLAADVPPAEIARVVGVAPSTVDYHIARLNRPTTALEEAASVDPAAPHSVDTRERVAALLAEGHGRNAIARTLGVSKSTVSYHAGRLGEPVDSRCARRYDWE
ncbi:MAG TPA: helix-turn-helix domain-containing protein, partial [Thermoleophilaceae bacterium]|nr:helix-turn-helix domain-containing protein [Thermoleophilaceae bacterium]